ncbi:MAG TPA: carboxymuconolactone decarboxylase family protein [Acidobacteriaceae bacterium]|nr:carboxymuconolactone decarboxylase family protein [Acidobacteriaceae bacterium]
MKARYEVAKLAPAGYKGLLEIERYLKTCGVEENILHLMKLRASQINGCAFCLDMHWKDLRAIGESERRLYSLDAWRENEELYNQRERAALAWCEAMTKITEGHVPDAVYDELTQVFNEKEIADLTLAVAAINSWNRIAIGSRMVPGLYQPMKKAPPAPEQTAAD